MYYFVSTNSEMILIMTYKERRGRRGRDRMVVGFTTTCAISAHHHTRCEFEPPSWRCILDIIWDVYVYFAIFIFVILHNKKQSNDTTDRHRSEMSILYIDDMLSWSGPYDSWIYNYLCNQCLSPLCVLDSTCDKMYQ